MFHHEELFAFSKLLTGSILALLVRSCKSASTSLSLSSIHSTTAASSLRSQIPLFQRGYEKDPAGVASDAIRAATREKRDVVLVDTAGRMQDNEPLMRSLSKLINQNQPDLVLFVGEALVGNDGVDQLSKFNQRLADLSVGSTPRLIDGILLTKFDTIDDKVRRLAAISTKSVSKHEARNGEV
jgi:signal recognition particle GTPase